VSNSKPQSNPSRLKPPDSAYRLARAAGLVWVVPEFPRTAGRRNVRRGFVKADDWARVRSHLRYADFRDACDFAFLCGAREMEILGLRWSEVREGSVLFPTTKTGRARVLPYDAFPQLEAVMQRRRGVRAALERAGTVSPWVFCFAETVKSHNPCDPLFKLMDGAGALLDGLRADLTRACAAGRVPRLLFHDFRRSAAGNFDEAGITPASARLIGGWVSQSMYSRYAIGDEREIAPVLPQLSAHLDASGWHSDGTASENSIKLGALAWRRGRDSNPRYPVKDTPD
jgi:integrase